MLVSGRIVNGEDFGGFDAIEVGGYSIRPALPKLILSLIRRPSYGLPISKGQLGVFIELTSGSILYTFVLEHVDDFGYSPTLQMVRKHKWRDLHIDKFFEGFSFDVGLLWE